DVVALAGEPSIAGIKSSPPVIDAFFQEVVATAPQGFSVLAGNASAFWPALALGAAGGILAGANVLVAELRAIWDAAAEGDLELARERHRALWPRYGELDGVVKLKSVLCASGLIATAETRPPLG
ncbi:MAG TPA: dihydrodipicolinate synthase family protein, partial [Acidimicrobiales bacterium]|nr:dihydrodipicolinate synthase family protein [Acidimicrobiales bacterium]